MKQQAAAEKLAQASSAATAAEQARIQGLIGTAKDLTGQSKYVEALSVIAELSKLTLSPEQRALVDEVKKTAEQQAAKAAADKGAAGAANALGGALEGAQ